MAKYPFPVLSDALTGLFLSAGLEAADARLCGDWLVDAEAAGVASHGMARAPMYLDAIRRGKIAARPAIEVTRSRPGVLLVDGGNGMGPVVGAVAIDRAVEAASQTGMAIAVVRRSNHYGAAGFLLQRAVAAGFAAVTCSNGSPAMAVWGGADPLLGTNPLAAAFPAAESSDFFGFDMATSVAAFGRIRLAERQGEAIPPDWAVGPDGAPTIDPGEAMRGALLPLGGSKGSALALLVEMLAGVLAGAGIAPAVGNPNDASSDPADVGHAFIVIDPSAFMPREAYEARAATLAASVRTSRPAAGFTAARLPGAGAASRRQAAIGTGVEVPEATIKILAEAFGKAGLDLPPALRSGII